MIATSPTRSNRKLTDNAERDLSFIGAAMMIGAMFLAIVDVTNVAAFNPSPGTIALLMGAGLLVMSASMPVAAGIADAGWIERKAASLSPQARADAMRRINKSLAEGRPATRRSVYAAIIAAKEAEIAHAQQALLS